MQNKTTPTLTYDNNEEEILHTNYNFKYSDLYFSLFCLLFGFFGFSSAGNAPLWFQFLWYGIFTLITVYFLYTGYKYQTEKMIITTNGIIYSNIFKKTECKWEDILKIEMISHREINSLLNRFWIEYIFITSKGIFSLKEKDEVSGYYNKSEKVCGILIL